MATSPDRILIAEWPRQYKTVPFGNSSIVLADGVQWLKELPENTLHAIVTDPPYGVKEYDLDQIEKMKTGKGGVWRLPPSFDGNVRAPLPRFTALNEIERTRISEFFTEWAICATRALRPGGHVFIATNSFIAPLIYQALSEGGLEFRGQVMRTVHTLRGGDRPKNAEKEFPNVSAIPRGRYEPWGIFRKSLGGLTVADCLRTYQTGGIRRRPDGNPFEDLIIDGRTPEAERKIANHPSIKPQSFLRKIVYASLPLGEGIVADPFMGSGSTIAAAEALGLQSVGVEINPEYFDLAMNAIPHLAAIQLPEENPQERLL